MDTANTGAGRSKIIAARKLSAAIIGLCATLAAASRLQAAEWRGLVPLRSTRADVERLLGPPQPGTLGSYRTKSERVLVLYADGPCGANSGGWAVPFNTVVGISVTPHTPLKVADLSLDESRYVKEKDTHVDFIVKYLNPAEGISYEVNTGEGLVTTIRYFPASNQTHLRCPSAEGLKDTTKFDAYSDLPSESEKKRLDSFAGQMKRHPLAQAYVMVYAGRRSRAGEAEARARRAREYLVKVRGIDTRRVVTVDSGHREEPTVELYLVPPGAFPPLATPTIDPDQVLFNRERGSRNNRRLLRSRGKR
jgi:hypothetical protein